MKKESKKLKYHEMRNKENLIKGTGPYRELGILLFAEARQYGEYTPITKTFGKKTYKCDVVSSYEINEALDLKPYIIKNYDGVQVTKNPSLKIRNVQRIYFPDFYAISEGQMKYGTKGPEGDFEIWFTSNCISPVLPKNLTASQRKLFICLWLGHELMEYMSEKEYKLFSSEGEKRKDDFNSFLSSRKNKHDFDDMLNNFRNRYSLSNRQLRNYLNLVSLIFENFSKYSFY